MNPDCGMRRASCSDLEALLVIERGCWEAAHWSEEMWRQVLDPTSQGGATRAVFVAQTTDGVVGFAVVQSAAGESELESVAVKLAERGCGVGGALCRAAIAWAAEQTATEMHLEVRASNATALRMYLALGFVEQGRRRSYYRDPAEDAVVMGQPISTRPS
jgi:ribosomal-protein-alanine N-acetyltransferase